MSNATPRLAFVSSDTDDARMATAELSRRYGQNAVADADVVVALGGDGFLLQTLRENMGTARKVFGMNRGTVGFLMNEYHADGLVERIAAAEPDTIRPLEMLATGLDGSTALALAINEVSLFRQTYQAAKVRISVDDKVRLDELICDGVMVATPAGSTAYNLSVAGPILPLDAPLLALTPVSPFRPRRWRGALVPDRARIEIEILEKDKRPVNAVADHFEVRSVVRVKAWMETASSAVMMFDPGHSLDERILNEQFGY